jgi:2-(1,2-epoxy-1,2-dihydrophenyl)acetyl-CoA isomerase
MSEERFVEVQVAEGVGWVRLNRPERLNALGAVARRQLAAALEQVERDPTVRCVVLIGSGRAFCAGADIREMQREGGATALAAEVGRILRDEYGPVIQRLRGMPKPVIAAVNGVAAGVGASLAMACDLRVCAEEASFIESFGGIGLGADGGASWLLPRLVGTGKALEMFFTARPLAAADAERHGLANLVVPGAELEARVRALAQALAAGATGAMAAAKQAVNQGLTGTLREAIELEAQLQEGRVTSADFHEGVKAFLEKRAPDFRRLAKEKAP